MSSRERVPLHSTWCFWHDKFVGPGATVEEYDASLQNICTVDSVQLFWQCFNNLPTVDQLKPKSSFHLMKVRPVLARVLNVQAGIKPIWEDPNNENGGFWAMRVKKEDTALAWRELLLACIGEQFATVLSKGDDICGLTVSVRQYDNILQLWNRDAAGHVEALFAKVKAVLPGIELAKAFYKPHKQHTAFAGANNAPTPGTSPAPHSALGASAPVAVPSAASSVGAGSPAAAALGPPPGFGPKR